MLNKLMNFMRDEEGASAVEYGLIVGLIAVALIVVLGLLSGGMENLFQKAADEADAAAGTTP